MDEWISPAEAAEILGVSRSTVARSLRDDRRDVEWPDAWRRRPLSPTGALQLKRSAVVAKAASR